MITKEQTYKKAFEIKQKNLAIKQRDYDMLLNSAYNQYPRLSEIEREQTGAGAALAIAAISGSTELQKIRDKSTALSKEKKVILDKCGVRGIEYDCPICSDTGYVNGKICECVKKLASEILIKEMSAEMPLDGSRFDNFSLNYYSDKDSANGNPKRRITAILKASMEYVINFDPKKSGNLLFMGSAGLGKTHLSLAIVSGLLEKGFLPIYGSAENLFSLIEKEKFGGENNGAYDSMVSCDLLVIDDLGAEMATAFTKSALYNLINTRLLANRPTIINTNLSMKEIETKYTARISSRLIGSFDAYKFIGEDIRQQKAIERMNSKD